VLQYLPWLNPAAREPADGDDEGTNHYGGHGRRTEPPWLATKLRPRPLVTSSFAVGCAPPQLGELYRRVKRAALAQSASADGHVKVYSAHKQAAIRQIYGFKTGRSNYRINSMAPRHEAPFEQCLHRRSDTPLRSGASSLATSRCTTASSEAPSFVLTRMRDDGLHLKVAVQRGGCMLLAVGCGNLA
jgi:hypothetical protein